MVSKAMNLILLIQCDETGETKNLTLLVQRMDWWVGNRISLLLMMTKEAWSG